MTYTVSGLTLNCTHSLYKLLVIQYLYILEDCVLGDCISVWLWSVWL